MSAPTNTAQANEQQDCEDARLSAVAPALLEALIQTRAALAELQNYIPMRYNRELQRLLASDQELIERAGGEV